MKVIKHPSNSLEKYRSILVSIILKHVPKCTIYLFGSRATGKAGLGSDIDLAIDAGRPLQRNHIGNIYEEIEESTIPYFVDVVDMHAISDEMKKDIEKEGIKWSH